MNCNEIMISDDDNSNSSISFVAEMERNEMLDNVENLLPNSINNSNLDVNMNINSTDSRLDDEIIEIKDISNSSTYKSISERDKLLAEFIDKCLQLEYEGMTKVIHAVLLPCYNKADEAYKTSCSFKNVLNKAINRIETDPDHTFSHIRDLCESLQLHKARRKVNLITLTKNINTNISCTDRGTKRSNTQIASSKIKKQKVNAIEINDEELQSDSLSPLPVIDLDEYDNDVQLITSIVQIVEEKENKGKENENILTKDSDNLLVLQKVEDFKESNVISDNEKVKNIEAQMAAYKEEIAKLDEQEVSDDSIRSPYIRSEKLKAKVVALYKEICAIKGSEPIKRQEIRLQVIDGHPPGPVKRLEKFLNDHIGSNGDPPFPDFTEVVNCVLEATITDNLCWNKAQILKEARALFTQCGQALQTRRQRREWRDLLDRVKIGTCDYDPADTNPQLSEQLNLNKQRAMKMESDILKRYTRLQYSDPEIISEPNSSQANLQSRRFLFESDSSELNENSDVEESTNFENNGKCERIQIGNCEANLQSRRFLFESDSSELNENSDVEESTNFENNGKCERIQIGNCDKIIDSAISSIVEVPKTETCSDGAICSIENVESTSTNMQEQLTHGIDIIQSSVNNISETSANVEHNASQVIIKPDPDAELLKIMDSFGNDYTATILEIQDPFLIIEISSDSDTDESVVD